MLIRLAPGRLVCYYECGEGWQERLLYNLYRIHPASHGVRFRHLKRRKHHQAASTAGPILQASSSFFPAVEKPSSYHVLVLFFYFLFFYFIFLNRTKDIHNIFANFYLSLSVKLHTGNYPFPSFKQSSSHSLFLPRAIALWNSLPLSLHAILSVTTFKEKATHTHADITPCCEKSPPTLHRVLPL